VVVFGVWLREGRFRGGSRWVAVVPFWGWIGVLRGERVGCGGLYRRRGWAPSAVARSTARPLWGGRGGRTRTILGDQRLTYPESATPRRAPPLLRGHSAGVLEFCSGLVDLVVRRTSPWRAWSSSHPCGRAIRGSGLRGRCGIFHLLSNGLRKLGCRC
jgi:hypothetical protein